MGNDQEEYLSQVEQILKDKDNKINELSGFASNNIMNQNQDPNLIVWQLELDNILDRIKHLLKGEILEENKDGDVYYTTPEDKSLVILNDYGVQLVMNVISFYLNRNTILSTYREDRIKEILFDLGNELSSVIYINYEKMGMTSMEKKSRYEILVLNILHTLESCYNRALGGGERGSLRSARVVTQSLTPTSFAPQKTKHSGGVLNPRNWKL